MMTEHMASTPVDANWIKTWPRKDRVVTGPSLESLPKVTDQINSQPRLGDHTLHDTISIKKFPLHLECQSNLLQHIGPISQRN